MLNKMNKNSGLLTLISVVGWIVFTYASAHAELKAIQANENQQTIILNLISDSLKEKSRDHREFQKSVDKTNTTLSSINIILIKLESTMDNLNEKIDKIPTK